MSTSDPRSTVEETETREPVAGLEKKLNQLCLLREAIGAEKVADEDGFVAIELIRQARLLQNDLAAALRTPDRQQGWRPIESRRFERGDQILGWCNLGRGEPDWRVVALRFVNDYSGWTMPGVGGLSPTHWMPLPAPPTESESRPVSAPTSEETRP